MSLILSSFDIATQLKKGSLDVQQKISREGRLAPELEAGFASDASADVWSLGQIGYQLMCCPHKDKTLRCQGEVLAALSTDAQVVDYLMSQAGNRTWKTSERLSRPYKHLICQMVLPDPRRRP